MNIYIFPTLNTSIVTSKTNSILTEADNYNSSNPKKIVSRSFGEILEEAQKIYISCKEWLDSPDLGSHFREEDWSVIQQIKDVLEHLLLQGTVAIKSYSQEEIDKKIVRQ